MELGVSDKGSTHRLMRDRRLFIKQLINKPCLSFTLDALRHVNSSPILHAYEGLFRPVAPTSNGRRRYCRSNSYIANKRGFVQIIQPSWDLSYQFDKHAINRSRR